MSRNPRISIIEDDLASRDRMVELFTALGYEIMGDLRATDVVLADVPSAERSLRLLYLAEICPHTPLLVTLRGSRFDAARLVRRYGVSLRQIVFKPYDPPGVAQRVAAELDWRRLALHG